MFSKLFGNKPSIDDLVEEIKDNAISVTTDPPTKEVEEEVEVKEEEPVSYADTLKRELITNLCEISGVDDPYKYLARNPFALQGVMEESFARGSHALLIKCLENFLDKHDSHILDLHGKEVQEVIDDVRCFHNNAVGTAMSLDDLNVIKPKSIGGVSRLFHVLNSSLISAKEGGLREVRQSWGNLEDLNIACNAYKQVGYQAEVFGVSHTLREGSYGYIRISF